MRSLGTLTARYLRELVRAPSVRRTLVLLPLAIGAGVLLMRERVGAGGVPLLGAGLTVLVFAGGAAALCAGWLVQDRRVGRAEWLATLAPARGTGRLAAGLGGWLGAMGSGLLVGVLAALGLALILPADGVAKARPLHLEALEAGRAVLLRASPEGEPPRPMEITLPAGAKGVLEIDVRPRFEGPPDLHRLQLAWKAGESEGELEIGLRGPVLVPLGNDGPQSVLLLLRTPGLALRLTELRLLEERVSPGWAVLLSALLLGLCAAAVAPMAVAVSRATSAPTAAAVAAVLLLAGVARGPLLELGHALAAHGGAAALASVVLDAVVQLAPPAPAAEILTDLGAARVPGGDLRQWILPLGLYTAVGLLLTWLPMPTWRRAHR